MGNGDRNVPWGAPEDSQGGSSGPPGWGAQDQNQAQGQGQWGAQGQNQWGSQGSNQGQGQGQNEGQGQGWGQNPNQNQPPPAGSQGSMTSFPLAATGAYAAVRPPEPPPGQAPPGSPPPMTSFPLAATGAYQAVGRQGNPDLSASGFGAMPPPGPGPAMQFTGPPGPPPAAGTDKRRRALLIGASAVAVAGVAAGAIALGTGGGGKKQPTTPASSTTASSAANSTASSAAAGGPLSPTSSHASQGAPSRVPSSPATKPKPPAPVVAPVADLLHWHLNDKPGSKTAADVSGRKLVGTLAGATGFSTAHGGSAEFEGAPKQSKGGQIQTKGPAIDTRKSFTVSMWADQTGFTTPTKYAAAFSQDGSQCYAFTFSYSLDSKKWSFVRATADGPTPKTTNAPATATTPLNVWVKLTGVYDAQAGTIAFYLNGVPQGAPVKTGSAPYAATGPFAIGRSWYGKGATNPFKGYISNVQVFGRALSAAQVKVLP